MGREIKRVPVDFDWPQREVWQGFLMPDRLDERPCSTCARPSSWYGHEPQGDGLTPEARAVHDTFYAHMIGGPRAEELAWENKIGQAEVDYLVAEGRLDRRRLFDRVELPEPHALNEWGNPIRYDWVRNDQPAPTAAEVNARSGLGTHDAINRMMLARFRCERLGIEMTCPDCDGHGSVEKYPGQRAEAEAWEREDPPIGDGWQLWETTSEGSPISPVFPTPEGLAEWLTTADGGNAVAFGGRGAPMTIEQARGFVGAGWAPSLIGNAGGLHDGAGYVGTEAVLRGHEGGAS